MAFLNDDFILHAGGVGKLLDPREIEAGHAGGSRNDDACRGAAGDAAGLRTGSLGDGAAGEPLKLRHVHSVRQDCSNGTR